jgi:16S rRNA (cytosine967-C5)-methyltransferase
MFKEIIKSLIQIFNDGAYLNITINNTIKMRPDFTEHDKKVYVRVTSGVVENKILLDYVLKNLISGQRVKPFVKNVLRVGTYMISFMNTPNHYVVNELVKITKKEDYRASTFVNAILRRYISENVFENTMNSITKLDLIKRLSILYSINEDLVKLLDAQYDNIEDILKPNENNFNTFRINLLKTNASEVSNILNKEEIKHTIEGVTLRTNQSLINHDLFKSGKIVAQDASSIRVAEVASPLEGMKVLDVCSAPGAKSMHMAALMNNNGSIISCDIHEHKIRLINENAERLGVKIVNAILADGTTSKFNELFDIVLTDVPCSGLGVINHKSDLKYNMTLDKIKEINALQKQILENASKFVKTKGHLVYSTCTINKDENERLINEFLKSHNEFKKVEEHIIIQNYQTNEDGFYIAKLERI